MGVYRGRAVERRVRGSDVAGVVAKRWERQCVDQYASCVTCPRSVSRVRLSRDRRRLVAQHEFLSAVMSLCGMDGLGARISDKRGGAGRVADCRRERGRRRGKRCCVCRLTQGGETARFVDVVQASRRGRARRIRREEGCREVRERRGGGRNALGLRYRWLDSWTVQWTEWTSSGAPGCGWRCD